MNDRTRPLIRPKTEGVDRVLQVAAAAGAVTLMVMVAFGQSYLPSRVPLHFNAAGEVDRWGSSRELILIVALAIALYGVLTLVARVPHRYNYPWPITPENAERQYTLARRLMLGLRAAFMWIFVAMVWGAARTAVGASSGVGEWFLPAILGTVGIVLALYLVAASKAR